MAACFRLLISDVVSSRLPTSLQFFHSLLPLGEIENCSVFDALTDRFLFLVGHLVFVFVYVVHFLNAKHATAGLFISLQPASFELVYIIGARESSQNFNTYFVFVLCM